ncbi:MAG: SHOCT domain-containing protein [Anaerolineales bacterium]
MGWHHYGMGGMGWGSGAINVIFMLLLAVGLFALIYFAVRAALRGSGSQMQAPMRQDEALQILATRLAKGELTADEYRELKTELES